MLGAAPPLDKRIDLFSGGAPRNAKSPAKSKGFHGAAMERVKGIEPSYSAWEADVLPMNYTRITVLLIINGRDDNFNCFLSKIFQGIKISPARAVYRPGLGKHSLLILAVHIPD